MYTSIDYVSGRICGDKCIDYESLCECGGTFIPEYSFLYCCIPKNETCKSHQGMLSRITLLKLIKTPSILDLSYVSCQNGQVISEEVFCEECNMCPISPFSWMALKSNCSHSSNHFCPLHQFTSKICMDEVDVSIVDYCSFENPDDAVWMCPKANEGLDFEQCFLM